MVWPVGVLAVLARVAGFIQFAPFWEPITTWLEPGRGAADRGDRHAGADRLGRAPSLFGARRDRRRLARSTSRKRCAVPKPWPLLEHKFYFDELYDRRLLPARRRAARRARCAFVERPLIAGSIAEVTRGFRLGSRRARPRPERPRPLATRSRSRAASPSSPSSSSRAAMTELALDDPDLPADGRRARRLARAAAARLGRLARDARLARRGRLLDPLRSQRFDFDDARRSSSHQQHSWFSDARRQLLRRPVRLLALARRADRRLRRGGLRVRLVGRPRAAARLLRAAALPHRLGRRRLLRAGPAALLRLLRGDADPALRADRRVGRRRAGSARRSSSSSTRSPARC